MLDVARHEGAIEREPTDCARDIAAATHDAAVRDDSRTNASADRKENRVSGTTGGAAPRFTQNVGSSIAIDGDAHGGTKRGTQLVEQWIVIPAADIWCPDSAALRSVETRHTNACCFTLMLVHQPLETLGDQRSDRGSVPTGEWSHFS